MPFILVSDPVRPGLLRDKRSAHKTTDSPLPRNEIDTARDLDADAVFGVKDAMQVGERDRVEGRGVAGAEEPLVGAEALGEGRDGVTVLGVNDRGGNAGGCGGEEGEERGDACEGGRGRGEEGLEGAGWLGRRGGSGKREEGEEVGWGWLSEDLVDN